MTEGLGAARAGMLALAWFGATWLAGCGGDTQRASYRYEVPTAATSPWPMMRRTAANDGRSSIHPPRVAKAGAAPWRYATAKGIFSVPVVGAWKLTG